MYIITQKDTYQVENMVFFAYSLEEALDRREQLADHYDYNEGMDWIIAEVLDESNWMMKLILKLRKKGETTNGN